MLRKVLGFNILVVGGGGGGGGGERTKKKREGGVDTSLSLAFCRACGMKTENLRGFMFCIRISNPFG